MECNIKSYVKKFLKSFEILKDNVQKILSKITEDKLKCEFIEFIKNFLLVFDKLIQKL